MGRNSGCFQTSGSFFAQFCFCFLFCQYKHDDSKIVSVQECDVEGHYLRGDSHKTEKESLTLGIPLLGKQIGFTGQLKMLVSRMRK